MPTPAPMPVIGNEYLYAVAPSSGNQSTFAVYQIDQNSGLLTQLSTATIPVRAAQNIAVDATGQNFYVTGFEAPGTNMDLVKVDPNTHNITPMPGQTFHTLPAYLGDGDCCPNTVAVDTTGKFAYVGGLNDGSIHVYSVDQSSGTWTEISPSNYQPSSGGTSVYAVAIDPNNKFLYESQRDSSFVNIWIRDPNSGMITPQASSPFQTGALTTDVSVSADGKYLFVPQYEVSHVMAYSISSGGSPLPLPSSPLDAGNAPGRAVIDPQDRFVFVLNTGAYNGGPPSVQAFKFDTATRQITAVPNSTFTVYAAGQLVIDATGKFLYALGNQQTMGWSIDQTTGALSPLSGSPFKITGTAGLVVQQSAGGTL